MAFDTPGLDAVAQKVGQGLDFLITECIIGKLGGFLDEKSAQFREKLSSAMDTVSASVTSGVDSAKSMVGLGPKGEGEREQGLELAKGHGIGLSAQRMAAMEGNAGGLGTREISAPEQSTYASLCSGLNTNQSIQCDQQNYSAAQLGDFAAMTGNVVRQQQGLAV